VDEAEHVPAGAEETAWKRTLVPLPPMIVLAACVGGVAMVLAAAVIGSEVLEKPLYVFLEEPTQDGPDPWYSGVVSTTGALLWWSAATVSYVTAWIARDRRAGRVGFWIGMAVLSTVLAIDDLFLLHEYVVPAHLHLSERFTAGAYAVAVLVIAAAYRSYLRSLPWQLGVTALVFFAVSLGIDDAYYGGKRWEQMLLLEEGAKLLGIANWTLFLVWASRSVLLGSHDGGQKQER
jgi:hypothetical protein